MTQIPPDTPAPVPERHGLRHWFFWLRAGFVLCLLPVAFLAAAAVMMIDREITAPSWIKERIEDRARAVLDDARLDFGRITLRIARDLHPTVRLVDTRVISDDGLLLTRVPVIEALLSPRGLILQRDVLVQEARLIGAQINLRRARAGDVSFALITGGDDLGRARSLPALLDQFDRVFERPALEALETVRADGLIVNFDDARAGRSWIIDGGRVALDLRGGQTVMRGDFALLSGRADVTSVNLSYQSPRGSRAAAVDLTLTNAVASDIAAQSPALNWLRDVEAPITANLRTTLDATGALGPLSAALEIGQGVLQPDPAAAALGFDAAKAYFTYDPVRDQIAFSEFSLQTGWGSLIADGTAYLRGFRDGLPRDLLGQFDMRDITLNPPGWYNSPVKVPQMSADLRLRLNPFRLELGQLVILDGTTRLIADGQIAATRTGWQIAAYAAIDRILPNRVMDFWPATFRPGARRWVANNVIKGQLRDVNFALRRKPGNTADIAVGFAFDDSQVRFLRGMPPMTDAAGAASIANHSLVVDVTDGRVNAPQGGLLQIAGSAFTIVDMRENPSQALLDLRVDSTITAALSILNQPPFAYLDRANVPVTLADGRARSTGQITWPMQQHVTGDSVVVDMAAQLRAVRSATLIPGKTLIAPGLNVTASRDGISVAGPVQIGQVAATGVWAQRFGDPARPGSQVSADVGLSQAFLDEFNIALPPGSVAGQGTGTVTIDLQPGQPPAFRLTSDLSGLQLAVPVLGWSKSAPAFGDLTIAGRLGDVPAIDSLRISAGGLQAAGAIDLTADRQLDRARFVTLRVDDWFDAAVTLQGRGAGRAPQVAVTGGTVDLRAAPFGQNRGAGDRAPVQITLDRLQVTEAIALTDFTGDFSTASGFAGDFRAQVNGGAALQGRVAPGGVQRMRSDDAGAVLRAAGLMRNVVGGQFDLTLAPVQTQATGVFDGTLALRDIRVRDAPTIAALLDAVSVIGLLQQLDGGGLAFEDVDAQFRLTPAQIIITQASAVGPGLGISVDGTYTLATRQIDVQGVVSPFFLINGIGSFLTRRGEGLIGFNFTITGTPDAPQVSVNLLSAFTPGMFREIFRRPAPEVSP